MRIEQGLATVPTTPVRLHPNVAQVYRRQVEQLQTLSRAGIRDEALQILRGLVERVSIRPRGKWTGDGDRSRDRENGRTRHWNERKRATLDEAMTRSVKVVAGRGFEPLTFRL